MTSVTRPDQVGLTNRKEAVLVPHSAQSLSLEGNRHDLKIYGCKICNW